MDNTNLENENLEDVFKHRVEENANEQSGELISTKTASSLGIMGALFILWGCVQALASVGEKNVSIMKHVDYAPIFFTAILLAFAFFGLQNVWGVIVTDIVNVVLSVIAFLSVIDKECFMENYGYVEERYLTYVLGRLVPIDAGDVQFSYGIGLWLLLAGNVVMLIATIMLIYTKSKE